jgi:predicted nucleic acid-binding Zn ribbon protein
MRRRAPRPIATAIRSLEADLAPQSALGRAQAAWSASVGPQIAAHAQPAHERGGTLTVDCDSAVWAAELEMQSAELLRVLNAALGSSQPLRRLRFRAR